MVLAKASIRDYGLDPTFSFETGASTALAPTVSSSTFDFNAAKPTVRYTFSQDVGASLHAADFIITNTSTGQTVPTSSMALAWEVSTRQLSISFPGYPGGVLPDGNYHALVRSSGVVGNAGNPMAADYSFGFFALAGDANHDRIVDVSDLGVLATNWQLSSRTFAQGDFNYDGVVDVTDLGILATNWQLTNPPVASSAAAPKRIHKSTLNELFVEDAQTVLT